MKNALLYLSLTFLLAGGARAADPELVEDIATGPNPYQVGPSQLFTFRGKVLFFTKDNEHRLALGASDGTTQGTELLSVLCPFCGNARWMGATQTAAFYSVQEDLWDPEALFQETLLTIWRTDGTRAGTYPVAGTFRMPVFLLPMLHSAFGGRLAYFTACTPELGCEIWSSDGTVAGTGPVVDRVPGAGSFEVYEMVALGDRAYALGRAPASAGLWRVDAAAHTVTRVRALPAEPRPRLLTASGGRLFFLARAGGMELWTSDGTTAGTSAVSGYTPDEPFLATRFLKPMDGRLYFLADDGIHGIEIWSADVAGGGLRAATDFRPHFPFGTGEAYDRFVPARLESLGGRLLFAANDGRTGFQLWTSRGRPGSTQRLTSCPGGCPEIPLASRFARLGTRVVFAGRDARHGLEPWISDGTGPGTRLLRDLVPGPGNSGARAFTSAGSRVFFQRYVEELEPVEIWATDGTQAGTLFLALGPQAESRSLPPPEQMELGVLGAGALFAGYAPGTGAQQLWRSNGTPAGTSVLAEFDNQAGSNPSALGAFGDNVLFIACRDSGSLAQLWVSGGTAATTAQVSEGFASCLNPPSPKVVDLDGVGVFNLPFRPSSGLDRILKTQVWRTDGTAAGTAPITSFGNEAPYGDPIPLAGKALFKVANIAPLTADGTSLWVTDGTAAGTRKVIDLPRTFVHHETAFGSEAFFLGSQMDGLVRVWRTDGTAAGTFPVSGTVSHLNPGFIPPEFTRVGDRVYFKVLLPNREIEIWSTDGTPQGTGPALTSATGMREPDSLWAAGGLLFFRAWKTGDGRQVLWRTDGTPAGTFPLGADLRDGRFSPSRSARFATLGDEVFFQAFDTAHGAELWKSDGTREGTVLVRDIFPGFAGSYPLWLVTAEDRLYFAANDGPNGRELWASDGTAEGTRRVSDIAPGASWSDPQWLTVVDDQLFFSADDGTHGRELWRSPLQEIP